MYTSVAIVGNNAKVDALLYSQLILITSAAQLMNTFGESVENLIS